MFANFIKIIILRAVKLCSNFIQHYEYYQNTRKHLFCVHRCNCINIIAGSYLIINIMFVSLWYLFMKIFRASADFVINYIYPRQIIVVENSFDVN